MKRNRNPQNNPTAVIKKLIHEIDLLSVAYNELADTLTAIAPEQFSKLQGKPALEEYNFQIRYRRIQDVNTARTRESMRLYRDRNAEQEHRLRAHGELQNDQVILDKVHEAMTKRQATIMPTKEALDEMNKGFEPGTKVNMNKLLDD